MKKTHDCLEDVNENKYRLPDREQEEGSEDRRKHSRTVGKQGKYTALQEQVKQQRDLLAFKTRRDCCDDLVTNIGLRPV